MPDEAKKQRHVSPGYHPSSSLLHLFAELPNKHFPVIYDILVTLILPLKLQGVGKSIVQGFACG